MKPKRPRKPARSKRPASKSPRRASARSERAPLLARMAGADHREVGGVSIDTTRAANGRVKRVCYPPGFRWSTHMKPLVNTPLCMHAQSGSWRGRVRGPTRTTHLDLAAPARGGDRARPDAG